MYRDLALVWDYFIMYISLRWVDETGVDVYELLKVVNILG